MEHPAVKRRTSSQLFSSADLNFSTILGEERDPSVVEAKGTSNAATTTSASTSTSISSNNSSTPSISAINAIANRLSHKRMRRRSSFGLVRGIESDPPVFTPGIWVDKISSTTKSPSPALSPLMNHVPTSVASSPVLARISSPHLPPTVASQGPASYGSLDLQGHGGSNGGGSFNSGGGGAFNFRPPTFQTQQPQQQQLQLQQTLHLQPTIRSSNSGANSPMMASPIISSTSSSTVTQSTVNTLAMMQQQQRLLIQQQNMNKSGSSGNKSANPSPRMSHTNLPPHQQNNQQQKNNSPMQKNLAPPMVIQSNGSPMLHPMNLPSQANMRPLQQQQFSNQQQHQMNQQPNNHPVNNHNNYHHHGASLLQQQIMSKAYVSPSPVFQAMSMSQPNWNLKPTDAFNSGISMNDVSPQIQQLPTPKKSHATNPTVGKLKAKGPSSATAISVSQSIMSSPTPELERVLEEREDEEDQESMIDVETESQSSFTAAASPRSVHQGIKRPASTALPFNALHSKAFKRGASNNASTPQAPPPSTKLSTVTSASTTPSPSKSTPKRLPKQKQFTSHNSLETKLFQFSLLPPQTRIQIFSYLSPVALAKFRAIDRLAGASVLWNPLLRAKDVQLHRNLTITHTTNLHQLVDVLRGRQSPSAAAENVVLFWNGVVDVFMKRQKEASRYSTEWIAFAIIETGKRVMNGMRCSACHMRPRVKDAVWCAGCGAFACGPKNFGKKCVYKG
ncbi:hypothetical protein HDU81_009139, partial [Chytriomyces hyalinus]